MGWVTDHFNCTLDLAFESIKDAVRADIKEANGMLQKRQQPSRFTEPESNGHNWFIVTGSPIDRAVDSDKYRFRFELCEGYIRISRSGPQTLPKLSDVIVKHRWDPNTSSCVLCASGTQTSAAGVSQIALEQMFFGV